MGFQQLLASQSLSEGTHWVRLFYSQHNRQPSELELLLDNDPWSDALAAAGSLSFPSGDGYFSLRMFMVIQGGLDIGRGIGIIAQHPEADDEHLEAYLLAAGISSLNARRIIVLAPIAFGRKLLQRSGVEIPTVCTIDDGSSKVSVDVQTSPVYVEAARLAEEAYKSGTMAGGEFYNVAGRDACYKAFANALNAGSKPENLKFAGATISWYEKEPLCAKPEYIPVKVQSQPSAARKPWWNFWS